MQEDYFYLSLNGERVFAGHYRPDMPASRAVVLCHPLGEEKLWAHRVFVTFAREMAAAGTAVLRFDHRGEGDSDRHFEHTDLDTRVEDASLAVATVRELNQSVTDVTLLGLRFGAIVAAMTAARRTDISRLVLWDAILDGGAYMQSVLRLNLMHQMAQQGKVIETREALITRMAGGETVNIEGYEMSEQFFRQTCSFQLGAILSQFCGQALLVQIGQDESPLRPAFAELARTTHGCQTEVVTEEPFWREIKTFYQRAAELTRATRQFLEGPA